MEETTHLKLKKPGLNDYVIIEDLNQNSDAIDIAVQKNKDDLATHSADGAVHIQAGEREKWNGKQNALPVEQRRPIYVSATPPPAPEDGDIWIEV